MFTIIDIINGKVVFAGNSKAAILDFWAFRLGGSGTGFSMGGEMKFDLLNVTGKDQMACLEEVPGKYIFIPDIGARPAIEYVLKLKPYQVRDGDGRSIDIKSWKDEIKQVVEENLKAIKARKERLQRRYGNPSSVAYAYRKSMARFDTADPSYRKGPCGWGSKCRTQYVKLSLTRDNLRAMCDYGEDEDVIDLIPGTGIPRGRKRVLNSCSAVSRVVDKLRNRTHSKSWKDQTKQRHQWAKHKHGATRDSIRTCKCGSLDISRVLDEIDPYEFDGCNPTPEDFSFPLQSETEYEEYLYEKILAENAG